MGFWLKNGLVYQNHCFRKREIFVERGRIRTIMPAEELLAGCQQTEAEQSLDLHGRRVVPGFLDIHTHGSAGVDVNAARAEELEQICRFQASQGVTSLLISVLTDTPEQTLRVIREYRRWKETLPHEGAQIRGIHLEGPFLAGEYKGAMPENLLCRPDMDLLERYQRAAGGDIRYITVSPEVEGVAAAIPAMCNLGITVAIGHSGADYETACRAIAGGARAATHTGNAMRLLHQHEPAIFGAVLESDKVFCEAICDGRHLHPGVVRLLLKVKGVEKVVSVTDSIMAAGLADGNYKLGVNDVIVRDGDARLQDGTRAGSTLTQAQALKNLLRFTGRPVEQVLPLLTENPARLLGLDGQLGFLEPGREADLTVLDGKNEVCMTVAGGVVVYQRPEQAELASAERLKM